MIDLTKLSAMNSEKLRRKARESAKTAREHYVGCAESTFIGIADTLGLEGKEYVASAMVGLSGGIANFGYGSCGAITGAAAALSLYYNFLPSRSEEDQQWRNELFYMIENVVTKFKAKYGGLSCLDVQIHIFGKAFDLRRKERLQEYRMIDKNNVVVVEDACIWAVEGIIELAKRKSEK